MSYHTDEDEIVDLLSTGEKRRLRASIQSVRCSYDGNMTIAVEEGKSILQQVWVMLTKLDGQDIG